MHISLSLSLYIYIYIYIYRAICGRMPPLPPAAARRAAPPRPVYIFTILIIRPTYIRPYIHNNKAYIDY